MEMFRQQTPRNRDSLQFLHLPNQENFLDKEPFCQTLAYVFLITPKNIHKDVIND
jgi:hypothetical protein